ncbi:hypothetical protein [Methylosinus sp. LW3]|uniref:hypothetical protein n=1 Tax=Methylosinus sp. LW3 TaxID=107635 RepID=UPI000465279E|nr:hypothetical protein [Methylosinus sp. LW3]
MGQKDPIKIDRGETICPIAGDGLSKGAVYKMPEPFDHAKKFNEDLEKVAQELADLKESVHKTRARIEENGRRIAEARDSLQKWGAAIAEARDSMRKDLSADVRADLYTTEALEAVDSNDPAGFEKALAKLRALPIGDDLSPRIAQLRRAAILRNPRFLTIIDKYRKD